MKAIAKLTALVILFIVIFVRCNNNNGLLPVIVPVEKMVNITASAGKGGTITPTGMISLTAGGSQSYKIVANDGYSKYKLKVNGVEQTPVDTYNFTGVLSSSSIEAEFISNYALSLIKSYNSSGTFPIPWHLTNISRYDDNNNFLDSLVLIQTPTRLTDNYYYYSNGTYEIYAKDTNKLMGNGTWSIDGQIINDGGRICHIIELTDKKFVEDFPSFIDSDGKSKHLRYTLERK